MVSGVVEGGASILDNEIVHGRRYSLARTLILKVPTIVTLGLHHITELSVTSHLRFGAIIVAQIVIVALITKTRQKVGHTVDAVPF